MFQQEIAFEMQSKQNQHCNNIATAKSDKKRSMVLQVCIKKILQCNLLVLQWLLKTLWRHTASFDWLTIICSPVFDECCIALSCFSSGS